MVPQAIYSSAGDPVGTTLCKEMPFIADQLRDSVFYLYDSEIAARDNEPYGGTGFFLSYTTEADNRYIYAVTNRHVIEGIDGPDTVIRVNTVNGDIGTISVPKSAWLEHPFGADVSVVALSNLSQDLYFTLPEAADLLTRERLSEIIRVGEDVYMLGRFIKHPGGKKIKPTARSGIISLLPDADALINYKGAPQPQEAFLIEMRSLSGFSGSPVFYNLSAAEFINHLRIAMQTVYNVDVPIDTRYIDNPRLFMTILGIDAGSFYTQEQIEVFSNGARVKAVDYQSNVHAGFAIVIPGWTVMETLDRKELKDARMMADVKQREQGGVGDAAKRTTASLDKNEFLDALKQASRRISESDSKTKET